MSSFKRMTRILNIDILSIRKKELQDNLVRGVVFTPNVDHLVRLQKDRDFYEAYLQADWVICDSVILHRLSRLLKNSIVESIPGSTFFREFCEYHRQDENCKIFILGGKKGVAQKAEERINGRVGRRMVVGACSPSFRFVEDEQESLELVRMISESGATVLVVCATSPKQEMWIAKYRKMLEEGHTDLTDSTDNNGSLCSKLKENLKENYCRPAEIAESETNTFASPHSQRENCTNDTNKETITDITDSAERKPSVKLFMALGATVDFEAGTVKRCPLWIQRLGVEWFWRFCQEPRRLFKRYWVDDMKFFWYFGKQLLGLYKNPFDQ